MRIEDFERDNISQEELNRAKSKANFLGDLVDDFLLVIRMLESVVIKGEYSINPVDLAKLIGAVVYVVFPFDLVPDIMLGIGYVDDISMFGMVLASLSNIIADYKRFEKNKS